MLKEFQKVELEYYKMMVSQPFSPFLSKERAPISFYGRHFSFLFSSNWLTRSLTEVEEEGMPTASILNSKRKLDDETSVLLLFSKVAKKRIKILQTIKHGLRNCNLIAKKLNLLVDCSKALTTPRESRIIINVNFGHMRFYKNNIERRIGS